MCASETVRFYNELKEVITIEKLKCPCCNQTLLQVEYIKGEIKCTRCKRLIKLDIKPKTEPRATP